MGSKCSKGSKGLVLRCLQEALRSMRLARTTNCRGCLPRFSAIAVTALMIAAASGVAGCSYRTDIPFRDLVIGAWTMSDASLGLLEAAGYERIESTDHRIVLLPSGGCEFRSYWIYSRDRSKRQDDYFGPAKTCNWQTTSARVDRLRMRRKVRGGLTIQVSKVSANSTPTQDATADFLIEDRDGSIVLTGLIGDPDQDETIDFIKAER